MMTPDPTAIEGFRLKLRAAGFPPVPVNGKKALIDGWQRLGDATEHEIKRWTRARPAETNTGILTRLTPAFDIDILDPEAAEAVEKLARERFEEFGCFLVRFGQAPKRAVLFRTDAPFNKIGPINLIAPSGEAEKLEFLASGQQIVISGVHPDTHRPYSVHGGVPGDVKREDLPAIDEKEALALIEAAVALLVDRFGYRRATPAKPKPKKANGVGEDAPADWTCDFSDHDALAGLAMRLLKSGMNDGAVVNFSRAQVETLADIDPKRKARRLKEIPGIVESARGKIEAEAAPQPAPPAPATLAFVHEVFRRWLGTGFDTATLDATLAVAAAEKLPGDPPWLMVISGPGNAKTETVQSVSAVDGAIVVSTIISEGALLSATPRKGRHKDATGGLLRRIGKRGLLVIKDFTSILSAGRELRAAMLAALREVHDGKWVRNVGTDGGQTLTWEGRIVVIGACTTAWDQAHGVISIMGDRFVLVRSDSYAGRTAAGEHAIGNTGHEPAMRQEMANAVAGLIATVADRDYPLTKDDTTRILNAADLVTLVRTGVELDYRGDVIDAHAPEMPTRFAKQLTQIMRGGLAIGMGQTEALALALRCARDSMPELRLAVLEDLAANGESRVTDIRRRLQKPRATADRVLQALHYLRLLVCREEQEERGGKKVLARFYSLASKTDPTALDPPPAANAASPPPSDTSFVSKYELEELNKGREERKETPFNLTDVSGIAAAQSASENTGAAPQVNAATAPISENTPKSARRRSAKGCSPPDVIVTSARGGGVVFVLAPDRTLFTLEWRGPYDPLIDEAIRDNYEAILAWLIREAEGRS